MMLDRVRLHVALTIACTLAAPVGARAADDAAAPPFVRAVGADLVIEGDARPFRFAGANVAVMHHAENRAHAADVLAAAAADGLAVVRVWAFGEGATDAPAWQRDSFLFRAGAAGWVDAAPAQLDRVLDSARRSGLRVILTLANNWADYGGVPQYLRWTGGKPAAPPAFGAEDRFYRDPRARAAYRAHVERLVARRSAVTGVAYRDDPTILAWELINESQVATTAGAAARRAWIAEMARLVHRLDPHHLVMAGVSNYRLERERREWLAICRMPEIDVCDGHVYPEDFVTSADDTGAARISDVVDDFVQLARFVAGKPFVMGELGVKGDAAGVWRGEPRGAWIARLLERVAADGAAGGLVWIYQAPVIAGITEPGHGIGVGDASVEPVRAAIRLAAAHIAAGDLPPADPRLGPARGDAPLAPLRRELAGPAPVVAAATRARSSITFTWEPDAYARSDWEAAGVWTGGALVHAWGTETGWFEYAFDVAEFPAAARPIAIALRARVSSEFPGDRSPPDGASAFEVHVDDVRLGRAIAPRDDGRGRWLTLRTTSRAARRALATPGRHVLRFTVLPGPHAHGLCIYGRPGTRPAPAPAPAVTGAGPILLQATLP